MADGLVCVLTLTVTGRMVNGKLEWQSEITTKGMPSRMAAGADVRDYEPEMCAVGREALEQYEDQCDAERRARG
jgi:hypothetical protein